MAIVEEEPKLLELTAPETVVVPADRGTGVFARPTAESGWRSWLFTVDHKKIGIMYGVVAMLWFFVGGVEALLVRTQLATPNGTVLSADLYNQLFTMHGITMVFLVIMPLTAAFMNFMVPLMIGARDVAFPRINALGLWLFVFGGVFLNISWLTSGAPDCGWFCYAPNSGLSFSPGNGVDYYALGLLIAGIGSMVGSVNLITTILNMRAPGMNLMKMPIFVWMTLVVQFLLLFSLPVITIALVFLALDRLFGANFFNVNAGADPLLWQHLFWIFGHPEVYILILPSFGIVSETLPVFSRKPLFGYPFVAFSGVAIGFMGFGVWAHHMFASGLGPVSVAAFSLTTMFIAVPTGVKILNWVGTMWGGNIRFTVPMMFSVSLVAMFTIGGLSGVMHAMAAADTQQTDSYFIVAHFHYVLFGGALMGLFGGMYYWWPKIFGHRLNERLGKWHFWLVLIGFNLAFGPMHILGLQGLPRRTYRYGPGLGFDFWNLVSTIGAYIILVGMLVFAYNILRSRKTMPAEGPDPWDARTIEWSIPSPAPEHNFDYVPVVTQVDDFWHHKYQKNAEGELVQIAKGDDIAQRGDQHPHLPSPSYWPLVLAAGFPLIGFGLIYNLALAFVGLGLILVAIYGWAMEPPTAPGGEAHPVEEAPADDGDGESVDTGSETSEASSEAESSSDLEEAPVG